MVKQRDIFDPTRIDILTDKTDLPQEAAQVSDIIRLHNEGVKVVIQKQRKARPISEAPLFGQFNAKQTNLF